MRDGVPFEVAGVRKAFPARDVCGVLEYAMGVIVGGCATSPEVVACARCVARAAHRVSEDARRERRRGLRRECGSIVVGDNGDELMAI